MNRDQIMFKLGECYRIIREINTKWYVRTHDLPEDKIGPNELEMLEDIETFSDIITQIAILIEGDHDSD